MSTPPPRDHRVLGASHPAVVELRRLLGRRGPRRGPVVLEGPRAVREGLEAGFVPTTLVVPASGVDRDDVVAVVAAVADRDPRVPTLVVRDPVFDRLAPATTPQPLLALVERPGTGLPDGAAGPDDVVVVLVGVSDPGNVGTVVRAADAAAASLVVVAGGADPWAPKAVRASAGSALRVPIATVDDAVEALDALHRAGYEVVGTDVRHGDPHDAGALRPPVAIVLGNEAHGLDPAVQAHLDRRVRIDLPGRVESLNVAMAATLLVFESRRTAATPYPEAP